MENNQSLTTPHGVVFEKSEIKCLEIYKSISGGVALISRDEDYFSLAKAIKDTLENNGAIVENVALDEGFSRDINLYKKLFTFKEGTSLVIAVGSSSLINLARSYLLDSEVVFVAVPTEVSFMSITANTAIVESFGVSKPVQLKPIDALILDLKFMAGLKKQSFADAFCEVSSKLIALIDVKLDCVLKDKKPDGDFYKAFKIIESLASIDNFEGSHIKIINSQYNFSTLFPKCEKLLLGAESYVALVLALMKNGSIYENAFFATTPIIKLYEAFLRCNMLKTLVSPDYNKRLSQLSSLSAKGELGFIKNYKPLIFDELKDIKEKIDKSDMLAFVKGCASLLEKLKNSYNCIYKGRQKRAGFDDSELKRGLILAPYLSGGLLKIISDSGVCECLEQ